MSSVGGEGGKEGKTHGGCFIPFKRKHTHTHSLTHSILAAGRRITNFNMSDGTVIIRSLGFHVESMSFNTFMLFAYLMAALGTAYLVLCFCVKERR